MSNRIDVPTWYTVSPDLMRAYIDGYSFASGLAALNVPKIGDPIGRESDRVWLGDTVTPDNVQAYHNMICHAAEECARSYSPFEQTATRLNSFGDGGFMARKLLGSERIGPFASYAEAVAAARAKWNDDKSFCIDKTPNAIEMWDAFDDGVASAIAAEVSQFTLADYGADDEH